MEQSIMENWFFNEYIPKVKSYLESTVNQEKKANLFMEDCAAHPSELISTYRKIICHFFYPNTTGLIQPADKWVILWVKNN